MTLLFIDTVGWYRICLYAGQGSAWQLPFSLMSSTNEIRTAELEEKFVKKDPTAIFKRKNVCYRNGKSFIFNVVRGENGVSLFLNRSLFFSLF